MISTILQNKILDDAPKPRENIKYFVETFGETCVMRLEWFEVSSLDPSHRLRYDQANNERRARSCFRLRHDLGARIRARRGRWPSSATIRGNFCCRPRPPVLLRPVRRRSHRRLYLLARQRPRFTRTPTRPRRRIKPEKVRTRMLPDDRIIVRIEWEKSLPAKCDNKEM